jgi:hypothetical protein
MKITSNDEAKNLIDKIQEKFVKFGKSEMLERISDLHLKVNEKFGIVRFKYNDRKQKIMMSKLIYSKDKLKELTP